MTTTDRHNVPSLFYLAQQACMKHVRYIEDVGDCPVEILQPILSRINNAEQLRRLELSSSQVLGHTSDVWHRLVKRDAPQFEERIHRPKDPAMWWKTYETLVEEAKARAEEQTQKLAHRLGKKREERDMFSVGMIDKVIVPRKSKRTTEVGPRQRAGQVMLSKAKKDVAQKRKFTHPLLNQHPRSAVSKGSGVSTPRGADTRYAASRADPLISKSDTEKPPGPAKSTAKIHERAPASSVFAPSKRFKRP